MQGNQQQQTSIGRTATDVGALSGVRLVAFLWVFANVYWLARRFDELHQLPHHVAAAAFLMLMAICAALQHRRWGWYAMVGITYVSLADMAVALTLLAADGVARGLSWLAIIRSMETPIAYIGEGVTFGLISIAILILSALMLDVDRAYVALAHGKRRTLTPAQFLLAAVVVGVYLFASLNTGPSRATLAHIRADRAAASSPAMSSRPGSRAANRLPSGAGRAPQPHATSAEHRSANESSATLPQ